MIGSADFAEKTKAALARLKKSGYLGEIKGHASIIKQSNCSGMNVYAEKPTFQVGKETWNSNNVWYAGTIAHDSFHSKLYHDSKKAKGGVEPPAEDWSGRQAEIECLNYQARVLRGLQAPEYMIQYVQGMIKNPVYQKVGAGKADPCEDRDW